jgi:hypothetical protein
VAGGDKMNGINRILSEENQEFRRKFQEAFLSSPPMSLEELNKLKKILTPKTDNTIVLSKNDYNIISEELCQVSH